MIQENKDFENKDFVSAFLSIPKGYALSVLYSNSFHAKIYRDTFSCLEFYIIKEYLKCVLILLKDSLKYQQLSGDF